MPTIDLGSVVGPQGEQGNTGPQGEQGVAGPSLISASTQTTLTGVLAGDGSTVGVRAVDGVPTFYSTNLITSGGVYSQINAKVNYAKSTTVNPNLLDNWFFIGGGTGDDAFPVNQRGQTSYIGGGGGSTRCIDRWSIREANNTLALSSDGVTASKGTSAQQCDFYQRFPTGMLSALQGKTVTATVWYANGLISGSFVWGSSASTVVSDGNITIYSGGSTTQYTNFCIRVANSQKIYAAKLEIGDTQTLCHNENGVWVLNEIPNYAEELYKCYRYLFKFDGLYTAASLANSNVTAITIPFPVPMRAAPAVGGSNPGIQNVTYYDEKEATAWGTFTTGVRFYNSNSVAFSVTGFLATVEI